MKISMNRFVFALFVAVLFVSSQAQALNYTYENTTSGAVNFSAAAAGAAGCATPLVRTFVVSDTLTVNRVGLGLNLTHTNRGDVRVTLVSPGGVSLQLIVGTAGAGGDALDNYDILMSSNSEGALADADADPVAAPFYNRIVTVANIDTTFSGVAGNGTWTLNVCDINNNAINGTFNRAYLMLGSATAATSTCTGTVTYDWATNGNVVAFTNTTLGDITMTQGATTDYAGTGASAAGTLGNAIVTRTTINGNHTGYYSLSMDANILGGVQEDEAVGLVSVISFSRPVRDLRFTFLDVDITAGSWEDQIEIIATGPAGNRVPYTLTPVAGASVQVAADLAEGDAAVATTATGGNLDVVFHSAVSSMTINYTQGSDPAADNQFMVIGISDFSFCGYDYGDAPNTYGTLLAGGARHAVGDRTLYLGTNPPDGEADGQAGAAATTDDTTQVGGIDDEDGVATFPNYASPSTSYTVSVTANNRSTTTAASLVGYIDWNRDGDFADANEISGTVNIPANTVNTAFNVTWSSVPSNAGGTTATYARFRISFTAAEVTSPTGVATSGEVEDFQIPVGTLPVTLASFRAERTAQGLAVEWTTETEISTVGYALYGSRGKEWVRLSDGLVPTRSVDRFAPERYRLTIPDQAFRQLALEDADLRGKRTWHGPFDIGKLYGREATSVLIDWAEIRGVLAEAMTAKDLEARRLVSQGFAEAVLGVSTTGLQRVRYEDLAAQGIDLAGAASAGLALRESRSARSIPIWVTDGAASPGVFGPGGAIEFYGEAITDSLYTRERIYRLTVAGRKSARVLLAAAPPQGTAATSYLAHEVTEKDLLYNFASPNGDPWYEAGVLAQGSPAARTFEVEVDSPVDSALGTQGRLKLDLWGVTNWPTSPDHHLQVLWNGTLLIDEWFDGLTARSYDLALPAGSVLAGTNQLEVRLPGDTGNAFDLVHVDGYSVDFARQYVARGDRLTIPPTASLVEVRGLSSPDVVVYADGGRKRLTGVSVAPDPAAPQTFRASFTLTPKLVLTSTGAVDVVTSSSFAVPRIEPARQVAADLETGAASYLVISHPALVDTLAPLVAARRAGGFDVKVVDIRDVYERWSGGEVDPQAIRSYVRWAARQLGTRYLLLVGADSYDYLNHLGIGSVSLIPTPYVQTDDLIRFTPSDAIYGDVDGDGLQDLAVGRFPARTPSELVDLVAKTLEFSATPVGLTLAADGDPDRQFSAITEQLASYPPKTWPVERLFVDDLGVGAARTHLFSAFDRGTSVIHYVGHSGPTVWSFQGLFSAADSATLNNVGKPSVVVQWGCWNTYHVAPEVDTLAHRLLLSGPRGAAAVIGSSTLSKTESDLVLGPRFLQQLLVPGRTVGEALVMAKREAARVGGDLRDVLYGWTLLGDPALPIVP